MYDVYPPLESLEAFLSERDEDARVHPGHVREVVEDLVPLYDRVSLHPTSFTLEDVTALAKGYLSVICNLDREHEDLLKDAHEATEDLEGATNLRSKLTEGQSTYYQNMKAVVDGMIAFLNKYKPETAALMQVVSLRLASQQTQQSTLSQFVGGSENMPLLESIIQAYKTLSTDTDDLETVRKLLWRFTDQTAPQGVPLGRGWLDILASPEQKLKAAAKEAEAAGGGAAVAGGGAAAEGLFNPNPESMKRLNAYWNSHIRTKKDLTCSKILSMTRDYLTHYYNDASSIDQKNLHDAIDQTVARFQHNLSPGNITSITSEDMEAWVKVHLTCNAVGTGDRLTFDHLHGTLNHLYNDLKDQESLARQTWSEVEIQHAALLTFVGYQALSQAYPGHPQLERDIPDAEALYTSLSSEAIAAPLAGGGEHGSPGTDVGGGSASPSSDDGFASEDEDAASMGGFASDGWDAASMGGLSDGAEMDDAPEGVLPEAAADFELLLAAAQQVGQEEDPMSVSPQARGGGNSPESG